MSFTCSINESIPCSKVIKHLLVFYRGKVKKKCLKNGMGLSLNYCIIFLNQVKSNIPKSHSLLSIYLQRSRNVSILQKAQIVVNQSVGIIGPLLSPVDCN